MIELLKERFDETWGDDDDPGDTSTPNGVSSPREADQSQPPDMDDAMGRMAGVIVTGEPYMERKSAFQVTSQSAPEVVSTCLSNTHSCSACIMVDRVCPVYVCHQHQPSQLLYWNSEVPTGMLPPHVRPRHFAQPMRNGIIRFTAASLCLWQRAGTGAHLLCSSLACCSNAIIQ